MVVMTKARLRIVNSTITAFRSNRVIFPPFHQLSLTSVGGPYPARLTINEQHARQTAQGQVHVEYRVCCGPSVQSVAPLFMLQSGQTFSSASRMLPQYHPS